MIQFQTVFLARLSPSSQRQGLYQNVWFSRCNSKQDKSISTKFSTAAAAVRNIPSRHSHNDNCLCLTYDRYVWLYGFGHEGSGPWSCVMGANWTVAIILVKKNIFVILSRLSDILPRFPSDNIGPGVAGPQQLQFSASAFVRRLFDVKFC